MHNHKVQLITLHLTRELKKKLAALRLIKFKYIHNIRSARAINTHRRQIMTQKKLYQPTIKCTIRNDRPSEKKSLPHSSVRIEFTRSANEEKMPASTNDDNTAMLNPSALPSAEQTQTCAFRLDFFPGHHPYADDRAGISCERVKLYHLDATRRPATEITTL